MDHTWPGPEINFTVLASPFHPTPYIWNLVLSTSPPKPKPASFVAYRTLEKLEKAELAANFLDLLGIGTALPPWEGAGG